MKKIHVYNTSRMFVIIEPNLSYSRIQQQTLIFFKFLWSTDLNIFLVCEVVLVIDIPKLIKWGKKKYIYNTHLIRALWLLTVPSIMCACNRIMGSWRSDLLCLGKKRIIIHVTFCFSRNHSLPVYKEKAGMRMNSWS